MDVSIIREFYIVAINKVEYKLDSSTEGFAVAGDNVTINKQNADTVKADVDAGNTETLTKGQRSFLTFAVKHSGDNVEYDATGSMDDLENGPFKIGNGNEENHTGDALGTMAAAGGAMVGATAGVAAMATATAAEAAFAETMQQGLTVKAGIMNSYTAVLIGGIDVASGELSIAMATTFDSNLGQRESDSASADDTIGTINDQLEILKNEIETLSQPEQAEGEGEGTAPAPTEGTSPTEGEGAEEPQKTLSDQIEELNQKLAECEANGDTAGAEEIRAQLEELIASVTPPEEGEEEDPAVTAEQNGQNAATAVDYGQSVASVLREGSTMGKLASINAVALTGCAVVSGVLAVKAYLGSNMFTLPNATAGSILCGVGTLLFGTSAGIMTNKAVKEFECGNKGNDVQDAVNKSQDVMAQHEELVANLQSQSADDSSSGPTVSVPTTTTTTTTTTTSSSSSSGGSSGGGSNS